MEFDKVIKSISYNQHEILYNIMQLYNDGNPFDCDMTYSKGKFYGRFNIKKRDGTTTNIIIPEPKYKFDVCPQTEDTIKIEPMGRLPLEDESLDSIVVDLPFVISKGPSLLKYNKGSNLIHQRFSSFSNYKELVENYYHSLQEAFRVLKNEGILVWKCQRTITGGKTLNSPEITWFFGEAIGFDCVDSFQLIAKNRLISGKIKKQQHSRSYTSTFYIFKKSLKKKIYFLEAFNENEQNLILNKVGKKIN